MSISFKMWKTYIPEQRVSWRVWRHLTAMWTQWTAHDTYVGPEKCTLKKKTAHTYEYEEWKTIKIEKKKNPDAIHVSGVMTTNAYMMLNQPYVCVETHEPIVTGIPFRPQMSLSLSFISYRIIVAQNTTCKNGNNATGYKGMLCSTLFFQQIENRRHCFYCRCACCIRTYASANGCPHQTNTISQRLIRS